MSTDRPQDEDATVPLADAAPEAPASVPPLPPPPDQDPDAAGGGGSGAPPPPPGAVPPPPSGAGATPPPGSDAVGHEGPVLRRSADDRVLAGVCGGIGHSFGIDPVIVRIAFVVFTLAWGSGLLVYAIAWVAIPEERPGDRVRRGASRPIDPATTSLAIGGLLVLVGVFLLADRLVPALGRFLWPLILIGVGVAVAVGGRR